VKFCKVLDERARRLVSVPEFAVSVPKVPELLKRFVVLAVVAKSAVDVALVKTAFVEKRLVEVDCEVVAFTPVKFWRVVEPV
jgi:hypothetical protein